MNKQKKHHLLPKIQSNQQLRRVTEKDVLTPEIDAPKKKPKKPL